MTEERLDWIERWLTGWKEYLDEDTSSWLEKHPFQIAHEVAVEMGLELVAEAKRLEAALENLEDSIKYE